MTLASSRSSLLGITSIISRGSATHSAQISICRSQVKSCSAAWTAAGQTATGRPTSIYSDTGDSRAHLLPPYATLDLTSFTVRVGHVRSAISQWTPFKVAALAESALGRGGKCDNLVRNDVAAAGAAAQYLAMAVVAHFPAWLCPLPSASAASGIIRFSAGSPNVRFNSG